MGLTSAARFISLTKLGHGPFSRSSSLGVAGLPSDIYESLSHFDVVRRALLRALVAALAEFELEPVRLPLLERLDHRLVGTVLPAVVALETGAARQAAWGLVDRRFGRDRLAA